LQRPKRERKTRSRNTYFDHLVETWPIFEGAILDIELNRIAALKARGIKPPRGGFKPLTAHQMIRAIVTAAKSGAPKHIPAGDIESITAGQHSAKKG